MHLSARAAEEQLKHVLTAPEQNSNKLYKEFEAAATKRNFVESWRVGGKILRTSD